MVKRLFVLVSDGGDDSYYPHYTFNEEWIEKMQQTATYPDIGCDGDGFHYDILYVPDECTLESLGCGGDVAEDYVSISEFEEE